MHRHSYSATWANDGRQIAGLRDYEHMAWRFLDLSRTIYSWARSSGRVVTQQADLQPAQSGPTEQGPNEGLPFGAGGIGVAHWETHP